MFLKMEDGLNILEKIYEMSDNIRHKIYKKDKLYILVYTKIVHFIF